MNRPSSLRSLALPGAALALALAAVLVLVASGALGRAGSPSNPQPTDRPSPPTSPQPTPKPTPAPTEQPSDGPIRIPLGTADGHDVTAVIDDETGQLVETGSGTPGDGMSVRWGDMLVENVGPRTIRLTWVALPVDGETRVFVLGNDDRYTVVVVQPAPPPYSDAIGFDRVLNLTFDAPVSADQFDYSVQETLDTAG